MAWIAAADYRGVARRIDPPGRTGQARIDRPAAGLLAGALLETGPGSEGGPDGHARLGAVLARLGSLAARGLCLDRAPEVDRLEALREDIATLLSAGCPSDAPAPRFLTFLAGPRGIVALRRGPTALTLRPGPRGRNGYVDPFPAARADDVLPELAARGGPVGFLAARGSIAPDAALPPAARFDRFVSWAADDRDVHGAIRGWLRGDRAAPAAVILAAQRAERALAG